jgi:aminoglycoside phosphotransferase (APT) family kinase protein
MRTADGRAWHEDDEGRAWRAYVYVDDAETRGRAPTAEQARQQAATFGRFLADLSDLPGPRLCETIPAFHDTPARVASCAEAIDADVENLCGHARSEIAFFQAHRGMADVLARGYEKGTLPERNVHNDAKLDNILFDTGTGEPLCVIDLDTVMPGLSLYDFGDMVRSAVSGHGEDERDISRIGVRMDVFEALVRGYLGTAGALLNEAELGYLPFSGALITFETGARFLADFLEGDHYFKTDYPEHNLDRCRSQFRLVQTIIEREEDMQKAVEGVRGLQD